MNFDYSPKVQAMRERLLAFFEQHIYPNERRFHEQVHEGDIWTAPALLEELKHSSGY